jgi:hypothetical protein
LPAEASAWFMVSAARVRVWPTALLVAPLKKYAALPWTVCQQASFRYHDRVDLLSHTIRNGDVRPSRSKHPDFASLLVTLARLLVAESVAGTVDNGIACVAWTPGGRRSLRSEAVVKLACYLGGQPLRGRLVGVRNYQGQPVSAVHCARRGPPGDPGQTRAEKCPSGTAPRSVRTSRHQPGRAPRNRGRLHRWRNRPASSTRRDCG